MTSRGNDFYARFGVLSPFDPNKDLFTSPFPLITMHTVDIIRSICFLISIITVIFYRYLFSPSFRVRITTSVVRDKDFLEWFTFLPFIFLATYYLGACIIFHANARRLYLRPIRSNPFIYKVEERTVGHWLSRPKQLVYVIWTTAVRTFPLYVTIVFWKFLASPQSCPPECASGHWRCHKFTTICALFEVLITNTPAIPWTHLLPCTSFLAIYLSILYRLQPVSVGKVYPGNKFLGFLSLGTVGNEIIAHCILFIGVFFVVKFIVHVRIYLSRTYARTRQREIYRRLMELL